MDESLCTYERGMAGLWMTRFEIDIYIYTYVNKYVYVFAYI